MPIVSFSSLPDVSRAWVFGSADQLTTEAEQALLGAVDAYLAGWRAHGEALTVGRDWCDHRFLTIAVDPTASDASGCSLDSLFRVFKGLQRELGTTLLDRGRVYYRDRDDVVQSTDRAGFIDLAKQGIVTCGTPVFDLSVQTLGEWRARFATTAARAWHAALLPNQGAGIEASAS